MGKTIAIFANCKILPIITYVGPYDVTKQYGLFNNKSEFKSLPQNICPANRILNTVTDIHINIHTYVQTYVRTYAHTNKHYSLVYPII